MKPSAPENPPMVSYPPPMEAAAATAIPQYSSYQTWTLPAVTASVTDSTFPAAPYIPPPPPAYAPPTFNYYSRARGSEGYAHSMECSTFAPPPTENPDQPQPQVISRGFDTKKKKKHPPPPPPQNPPVPEAPQPYPQPPYVPYPPFFPGARVPQHPPSGYYQPQYFGYPYMGQTWYGYQSNAGYVGMTNPVPAAPVMPPHVPASEPSQAPPQPTIKDLFNTTEKKWKSERILNRQRSNTDSMPEVKKEEENPKYMSSTDCSVDSLLGGTTFDARDPKPLLAEETKKEEEVEKLAGDFTKLAIKKHKDHTKKHSGGAKKGRKKIENSSKVKWVKKSHQNPELSTSVSVEVPEKERFLNKVEAAHHNIQARGIATDKETLLTEGQRTYYNKGGITTPRRTIPAGAQGEGSVEKLIFSGAKDDPSATSHHPN